MKNIIVIFLFFFVYSAYSQKSGVAYYKKTPTKLYTKRMDSVNNLFSDNMLDGIGGIIENLKFELQFTPEVARFKEIETMSNDTKTPALLQIAKITSGYSGETYHDFRTKKIISKKDISGQTYLIEKDVSSFNWVLTKEKLIINGLSCFKAKTTIVSEGRRGVIKQPIVAWYTTDINVSAGPDGFAGLPGLIIQLENEKYITVLDKIVFKKKPVKIELPIDGKKMTQTEFNNVMKKMSENRRGSGRN